MSDCTHQHACCISQCLSTIKNKLHWQPATLMSMVFCLTAIPVYLLNHVQCVGRPCSREMTLVFFAVVKVTPLVGFTQHLMVSWVCCMAVLCSITLIPSDYATIVVKCCQCGNNPRSFNKCVGDLVEYFQSTNVNLLANEVYLACFLVWGRHECCFC